MIKIAVLGYGTVGSGVVELVYTNAETLKRNTKKTVDVKYIVDIRDFSKDKYADKFVADFSVVENDPEVKIVVETIGGTNPAYDFTKRALLAGKSVITSNKELVATHGAELLAIAEEKNVNYLFEASVGGGIPVIRPLDRCLGANDITEVCGILNGTTNYILTRMIKGGLTFEKALFEAQEKGYAERNPSADIEGHDACRKICILASLAFGRHIYPEYVKTEGITGVSLEDVAMAAKKDKVIRLLGRTRKAEDGRVFAFVGPHLVDKTAPLAAVEDVYNAIEVSGNMVGKVMFYGPGAGKLPTASAVAGDIVDAIWHLDSRKAIGWADAGKEAVADMAEFRSRFYVRVSGDSARSALSQAFGDGEFISGEHETGFITNEMAEAEFEKAHAVLSEKCSVKSFMRVL